MQTLLTSPGVGDIKQRLLSLSSNFDSEQQLSDTAHGLLDTGILSKYDETIEIFNKLGIKWDKRRLKLRDLANLLEDTNKLNSLVNQEVMIRFNKMLNMRKERMAFRMDKVFSIRELSTEVYDYLAKSAFSSKA